VGKLGRRVATVVRGVSPRLLVVVLAAVWLVGLTGGAEAHTLDTAGFSEISQHGDDVRYELLVDYAALAIVTGVGAQGDTSDDDAEVALEEGVHRVSDYLDERLQVLVDGVPCVAEITETAIEPRLQERYARVVLRYDCPGAGEYTVRYSVLVGDLDPGHSNVAGYELDGVAGEFVFDAENTELVVGERSLVRQLYRFAVLGFEHILSGLDHVLFVIALLMGARSLRDVLGVVTAFTAAHSITLVLAAFDVVHVPSSVVEPLIALSIAYVAAASLLGRTNPRYRLVAVFGFGLLHGMGFAGALRLTGEVGWPMLSSLLSFNIGIEMGQALIVAVLFPLLWFMRKFEWSRYLHLGATGLITLAGLAWFVERLVAA
jgi:hydrogenase/urease accessory protein HupE